jgi:hypothetical protein
MDDQFNQDVPKAAAQAAGTVARLQEQFSERVD